MSRSRLGPEPALPAGPRPPGARAEDPESPPPGSKRARVEEPGRAREAAPLGREVERVWEWSPGPSAPPPAPEDAARAAWAAIVSGAGPLSSLRAGRAGAPEGSLGVGLAAAAPQAGPSGASVLRRGAHRPRGPPPPPGGRPAGARALRGSAGREAESTRRDESGRCRAHGGVPSRERGRSVPWSPPKMPKLPNPRSLQTAQRSYFRESIPISSPDFPRDLNSNVSFVYLKETAKKKSDTFVAYVRDFTNIYWSQNRPDAKKRKLQDEKKTVVAGNLFSDYYESHSQTLSDQSSFEGQRGSISLNYLRSIRGDGRESAENFPVTVERANWEEAEMSPNSSLPTRLDKCQNWDCNIRSILHCGNMKKLTETLNLAQLLEIDHLNKEDYQSTKAIDVREQQLRLLLMMGILGSPPNLRQVVWLDSKGENASMLQSRHYTIQKDFHVRKVFQSSITEICYFSKTIFRNKKDSISACFKMSTCEKHIGVQNVIARNMNANIKGGILSKYLHTSVPEHLNTILKTDTVSLLKNFSCFIRTENDCELEEGCLLKWVVHLNNSENILMESHTVYLKSTLSFSRLLEDHGKPIPKKRKLLKTRQVLEGSKEQNINSFSVTTLSKTFPSFEIHENFPSLMDFDNMGEITLKKESSYENTSCPEQFMNVENWAHASFNTVITHVKSGPQFTQNSHGYASERINMNNCDLGTERKQEGKTSHFNFKFIFEDVFNVKKLVIPSSQKATHSEQMKVMPVSQELDFENLLSETEEKTYDFIWKEDEKVKVQSSTNSCQVHKDMDIEKDVTDSFPSTDSMYSVQSVSLLRDKENVEETKSANQDNRADRNEYERSLQESELTNSKHFHLKNDSELYGNRQFESDLREENNECFQGLTAKCLSTEALTIARDFQTKSNFDLVLQELRMFHEISNENEMLNNVETNSGNENCLGESNDIEETKVEAQKDLKVIETNKIYTSSLPCDKKAGPNMHKRCQGLFKWKTLPNNGEQEVPHEYCCPGGPQEELLYSISEEDCKKTLPKRPAFITDECKEENYNYLLQGGNHLPHGISRIQPLKTCSRPIRVGLSRKASLKQLHPYLK